MVEVWKLAVGEYYVSGKSECQIQSIDASTDTLIYIENPDKGGFFQVKTSIQEFADRMNREGRN